MEGAVNLIYRACLLMTENHRHWNTQKVRLKRGVAKQLQIVASWKD